MKPSKKQIALLDICYSDYFTGYHLAVLAIPLYGTMTNKDIAECINSELLLTDYIPDDHLPYYQKYIDTLLLNPEDIFYKSECECSNECECECYAYFSLINPVTRYGITFLNP